MSNEGNMDRQRRTGFTLIELLLVMAMMMLIMGMGVAGWFGIRRGAEMRGAVSSVRTTLMLGRQQAVTKRQKVRVEFVANANTNLMRIVTVTAGGGSGTTLHQTEIRLPLGIEFVNPPAYVEFVPTGSAGGGTGRVDIAMREKVQQVGGIRSTNTVRVWPLTGVTRLL